MHSEGYCSLSVCVLFVDYYSILALQAKTRLMSDINSFSVISVQKIKGDFPETAAFELEKLAVSLKMLPGPTLVWCSLPISHGRNRC